MISFYYDGKQCAAYIFGTPLEPIKHLILALNSLFLNRNIWKAVVAGFPFFGISSNFIFAGSFW